MRKLLSILMLLTLVFTLCHAFHPAQLATADSEMVKLAAPDGESKDLFGGSVGISGDTVAVGAPYDDYVFDNTGSVYIYVRVEGIWCKQTKLRAADGTVGDRFGYAVSVHGDTLAVGVPFDDANGAGSGSVYVFTRSAGVWSQQQKLVAADAAEMRDFGYSLALSGDTLVIGSPFDDPGGADAGSVYVFTRSAGVWSQQQKLIAADGEAGDNLGFTMTISGDTLVAGAPGDDDNGTNSGSAYVFTRSAGVWSQQQKLTAADGEGNDRFGWSVSIGGETLVIGAIGDDDIAEYCGSVYVFTRSGSAWSQQQKLVPADEQAGKSFGSSVGISGDITLIGAPGDTSNGYGSGSAYIFSRSAGVWTQQAKLMSPDAETKDWFGTSVDISDLIMVIGAPEEYITDDPVPGPGFAYIIEQRPSLISVNPIQADQGETIDVVITGEYLSGSSELNFGPKVNVNNYTVDSATQITANITVAADATVGLRDVTVTTPLTGTATLSDGFIVEPVPSPVSKLTSASPAQADQGETLDVVITGEYLSGASVLSFGPRITVNSYTVDSATQITANITVASDAVLGLRNVSVTTSSGIVRLFDGFTVEQAVTSGGGCGASATAASTEEMALSLGIVGLLSTTGVYIHKKRKRLK